MRKPWSITFLLLTQKCVTLQLMFCVIHLLWHLLVRNQLLILMSSLQTFDVSWTTRPDAIEHNFVFKCWKRRLDSFEEILKFQVYTVAAEVYHRSSSIYTVMALKWSRIYYIAILINWSVYVKVPTATQTQKGQCSRLLDLVHSLGLLFWIISFIIQTIPYLLTSIFHFQKSSGFCLLPDQMFWSLMRSSARNQNFQTPFAVILDKWGFITPQLLYKLNIDCCK